MFCDLLFEWTGYSIFTGRLFRAGAASITAAILVFALMPAFIRYLKQQNATSDFDDDKEDKSPPILGGALLVAVTVVTVLLFTKVNSYVVSTLLILIAYAGVGFLDDVMKIRNKRLVLAGKISKADYMDKADGISAGLRLFLYFLFSLIVSIFAYKFIPELNGHLTIPFVPPEIWNPWLPNWLFIPFMSITITAIANGTNFTDGLDSLASVPIITSMIFVGLVAYFSGNAIFADYLNIPYLPSADELFPFAGAIIGAFLAYLWFNAPPAQIYLGDAGSIGFGGAIGIMFILVRAELFFPFVGIVIVAEAVSVVIQIGWFKISGGKRFFLMAPLHHHYQKKWAGRFSNSNMLNSKIIWRMHLVSLFALIFTLTIYFKVR
jgi:phospho-N-acetylmuramoyl-pentapeptide-transferase